MALIDSIISSMRNGGHPPALIMSEEDALFTINTIR